MMQPPPCFPAGCVLSMMRLKHVGPDIWIPLSKEASGGRWSDVDFIMSVRNEEMSFNLAGWLSRKLEGGALMVSAITVPPRNS